MEMANVRRRGASDLRKASADLAPARLIIRCVMEGCEDHWQAFSLEFGLAVQGRSQDDVRRKLECMIKDYVLEAVTVDREHASSLLNRRATWQVYLKYWRAVIKEKISRSRDHLTFNNLMPLSPNGCAV